MWNEKHFGKVPEEKGGYVEAYEFRVTLRLHPIPRFYSLIPLCSAPGNQRDFYSSLHIPQYRHWRPDIRSPPTPPLSLSLPFLLRFSCFPSLTARTDSASFPARRFPLSLDPRASFVRSFVVFNPPLRQLLPPGLVRTSNIVDMSRASSRESWIRGCRRDDSHRCAHADRWKLPPPFPGKSGNILWWRVELLVVGRKLFKQYGVVLLFFPEFHVFLLFFLFGFFKSECGVE